MWNGYAIGWFKTWKTGDVVKLDDELISLEYVETDDLSSKFLLKFQNKTETARLDESAVYKSFYGNNQVREVATKSSCALMDIALAKGGPEAIAESFYNCMRCQQLPGGQSNYVLTTRAKVAWCFPSIQKCGKIIDDAVSLYISGDDKIKGHRKNMFMDSFHKKNYTVSKVIDRVNADCGRCPFLSS